LPKPSAQQIAACVKRSYSIDVQELAPSTSGEMSYAFVATDVEDRRWWLKLRPPTPGWPLPQEQVEQALRLTVELRQHVHHAEVVTPIASSTGQLVTAAEGFLISVYPYIDLRPVDTRTAWPDKLLAGVATAIGEIHSAQLENRAPVIEDFTLWPHESLPEGLAALESLDSASLRPGQRRARDVARDMQPELSALIEGYSDLQQRIDRKRELVLCHMDLTPNNVTLDPAGRLHIIDWDMLSLAAPEFDIRWLLDFDRLDLALDAYEAAGGRTDLSPAMFAFYFHRRCLAEELAVYVADLLRPDRTKEEDAYDVAQLESIVWAFGGGMERWVQDTQAALAARRRK
jgi:Ser/Thr protein kinase RdoA (MazF antagonist)